jgi:tripartite-type tricarboxylate transporter receptor subunit TctC
MVIEPLGTQMNKQRLAATLGAILLLVSHLNLATAHADEPFYQGKTIRLLIGQPPGGGYDTYARLFARFLPQFVPGQPTVVLQHMPGAGGLVMANYLYTQAPHDGTTIALGSGGIATAALFGIANARFDARRFSWIGNMNSEVGIAVAWHQSSVKTTADLFDREFIVGGSGANSDSVVFPNVMNAVLGTRFKVVPGYKGMAEIVLAMERGEVQGTGNWHYSSIVFNRPDWLRDKKIALVLQIGLRPHPDLPDVPTVLDIARDAEQKEILQLVLAQQLIGRPIMGPPGMPAAQFAALQKAFDDTMRDPGFLAEAERGKIEIIEPMSGEAVRQVLDRLHAADSALIKKASAVFPGQSN